MIFNHSEKDYQDLQKTNWENINYLNGKIEKLEKENVGIQNQLDFFIKGTAYKRIEQLEKENELLVEENDDLKLQRDGQSITITELKKTIEGFRKGYADLNDYSDNLKLKLANQKYLDRQEVEKIFDEHTYVCEVLEGYNTKELVLTNNQIDESIAAICNLALPQVRTSPFTDEQNEVIKIDKDKLNKLFTLENDADGYYQMVFYIHTDGIFTREAAKESLIEDLAEEIIKSIGGK